MDDSFPDFLHEIYKQNYFFLIFSVHKPNYGNIHNTLIPIFAPSRDSVNQKQMEGLLNLSVTLPIFLLMDVRRSSRRRDTDVCHSENLCPIPDLIGFEYKTNY